MIIFAAAAAVLSLVGGVVLTMQKDYKKLAGWAAAFAAGALLATVALDLLPHIAHGSEHGHDEGHMPFVFLLVGILLFFMVELILNHTIKKKSIVPLVVIGDILHNIIDGAVIAAGFLISVPSGIIVTLTVVAHELPHEVGDFGLMLHNGVNRKKTIFINAVNALFVVAAAALFFGLGDQNRISTSWLLGLAAGFFLYVAFHVILEIHHSEDKKTIWKKTGYLFAGLFIVGLIIELIGH